MREEQRSGLEYLEAVTALLRRARNAHPTKGLYQAAELHWWWRVPRRTDDLGHLFWFDDTGRPAAAVVLADFTDGSSAVYDEVTFCPLFMPDATPQQIAHVIERGLALAGEGGYASVELEVDRADDVTREVLAGHGFTMKEEGVLVEAWLPAESRPEVSPLYDGYRLASRAETMQLAHHMSDRGGAMVEERLLQTSLYRSDLDLVVLDGDDQPAAYGLFWYDPETATGVVEPMRTLDEHQRRGLGRHILTAGVGLLIDAGAERVSIGYEPDNPASGHLYRSVGFEPVMRTDLFSGPSIAPTS